MGVAVVLGGLCVSGIWGPFSQRHTDIQVRVASPFVFRKAEEGDEGAVGGWMDGWLAGTLCPLIFPKILPPSHPLPPPFQPPHPSQCSATVLSAASRPLVACLLSCCAECLTKALF